MLFVICLKLSKQLKQRKVIHRLTFCSVDNTNIRILNKTYISLLYVMVNNNNLFHDIEVVPFPIDNWFQSIVSILHHSSFISIIEAYNCF